MPPAAAILPALGSIGSFLGPVGTIMGAVSGAQSLLGGGKQKSAPPVTPTQAPAFTPVKPAAVARPTSLADYSNFDPAQERSALATKGTQGGLGKPEQDYYKNLVQRSLIGDNNTTSPDTSSLLPVESQYFSGQGMNTSDIKKFLQQLQGTA